MNNMRSNRGFTLIELLVVVAIIGLLASIVIASLNTARMKGRDARRVADLKQLSLALEMYNDANSQYAPAATSGPLGSYIAAIPTDPKNSATAYNYAALQGTAAAATTCGSYHLGGTIEQSGSASLNSKAGKAVGGTYPAADGTVCTTNPATTDFDGTVATAPQVYDVRP